MPRATPFGPDATSIRRPGVAAAVIAIVGVTIADAMRGTWLLEPTWVWFAAGALLGAAVFATQRAWARQGLLGAALLVFVAGWTAARSLAPARDHLTRLLEGGERIFVVEGVALTPARVTTGHTQGAMARFAFARRSPTFVLDARRLIIAEDGLVPTAGAERVVTVQGRFWAHLNHEDPARIEPGRTYRVVARAAPIRPPLNPGERDYRPRAMEEGFAGRLDIAGAALVTRVDERPWLERIEGVLVGLREGARARTSRALQAGREGSAGRAFLSALLLGERDPALRALHESFTRLGLSHLLAISGLNLVVLAGALALLVRLALVPLPLWLTWRLEPAIVSVAVIAYLIVLPVQPSILRAGLMTLALLIPPALGRRHDRVNTLGWTLVVILLHRPYSLFSPGLQLSFGVVLALLTLTNPLRDRLFGRVGDPDTLSTARRAIRAVQTAFTAALVAWGVAMPCIAFHTGIVTPLAVPATLLAAPGVSLLTAWGYVTLLITVAAPGAAEWLLPPLIWSADALASAATIADGAPYSILRVPAISAALAIVATGVIGAWLVVPRDALARFPRWWRLARLMATFGLAAWIAAEFRAAPLAREVALRVDALHVGDGSTLLLRAGEAGALWDAGGERFDLGVYELPGALRTLRARNVHDVFITHANLDHYNLLPDLLEFLPVQRVYTTRHFLHAAEAKPDGPEAAVLRAASAKGVRVLALQAGDVVALGPARLRVLWPPADLPLTTPDNDASLVARFERADLAHDACVLLTGDIQARAMRALLREPEALRAAAMELPHHGSAGAMPAGLEFVRGVGASVVLQSTGPTRVDDDRWDEARGAVSSWLVTARDGAVCVEILRDGRVRSGSMRSR